MKNFKIIIIFAIWAGIFNSLGCGKSADSTDATEGVSDPSSNASQAAMSQAGSSASASEGGAVGFMQNDIDEMNNVADFVDPKDATLHLMSACTFASVRSACSASADTITWNGCTVDGGLVTLTGGWTENYSGTGAGTCTIPVANGGTITRTSTGSTMTFPSGATIVTDTSGGTAWDNTTIPSTGESIANAAGTRTITINGIHRVMKGPRGQTWFNHYLTSTGLTVTGTRAGGNRAMSGALKLYHNIAQYNATSTFNTVTWGSALCCYPTSGNISTTFTGSVTGTATLTFTSTCGAADFVDTTGASSSLTLTQCN